MVGGRDYLRTTYIVNSTYNMEALQVRVYHYKPIIVQLGLDLS